ncbi:MAG: PAS domain S-box-containing protein [Myxococcota bacterium]
MSETIEQLRAQLAAAERERDDLRALIDVLPLNVTTFTQSGQVVAYNRTAAESVIFPEEQRRGASLADFARLLNLDPATITAGWATLPEGLTPLSTYTIPHPRGGEVVMRVGAFKRGGRIYTISEDITASESVLRQLQHSEERLRRFFEASVEGILFREGAWITDANEAAAEMLGTSVEALRGRAILDFVAPAERAWGMRVMTQLPERYRISAFRVDGTAFPIEVHAKQIGDGPSSQRVICFLNIHEQEAAAAALRESQALFEALSRAAPVALIQLSADGLCRYANQAWVELTGQPAEEALGEGWWAALPESDRPIGKGLIAASKAMQAPTALEYRVQRPDGETRWVFGQFAPLISPDRDITGFVGTLTDITDRKSAEEERSRTLKQKELLLQEIHHRVKNNLLLVSSLLLLQAREVSDPVLREAFSASQARIRAMALLHSNLYATTAVDRVSFGTYTTRLVRSLIDSIGRPDVQIHVDVSLEGSDDLNIQQAIPCGLIINELLTNAFKHAFPPPRAGNIWLRVWREGDQRQLRVRDDGVGHPSHARASLGTRLVTMLTEQLGGTLEVSAPPQGGTQTDLRF